jgi:biotin synthase
MTATSELEQRIKDGYRLPYDEAVRLSYSVDPEQLAAMAGRLRAHFLDRGFDTCSIMNARSGRCPEDCKWCSQSRFHATDIEIYPLVGVDEAVEQALHNAAKGVRRFSLVTSGRTMSDAEVSHAAEIYRAIASVSDIYLCASMGLLTRGQLRELYDAGVRRYHCNLETAPSFFAELCTTHTPQQKIETLLAAREAGMELCSGGIIGMGETREQRVELAVALRDMGVRSVPVNVLSPIAGTPLEGAAPLPDDEIIVAMAMMRIVNPEAHIRLAGGRERIKHLERRLLHGGVSASIVGDMLTTAGSNIDTDKKMFADEGFCV